MIFSCYNFILVASKISNKFKYLKVYPHPSMKGYSPRRKEEYSIGMLRIPGVAVEELTAVLKRDPIFMELYNEYSGVGVYQEYLRQIQLRGPGSSLDLKRHHSKRVAIAQLLANLMNPFAFTHDINLSGLANLTDAEYEGLKRSSNGLATHPGDAEPTTFVDDGVIHIVYGQGQRVARFGKPDGIRTPYDH